MNRQTPPSAVYHVYKQGATTLHITDYLIGANSSCAAQGFFDRVHTTLGLDVLDAGAPPQYVRTYHGKPPHSNSDGEYAIFVSAS